MAEMDAREDPKGAPEAEATGPAEAAPQPAVKRNTGVLLVVTAAVALMMWVGVRESRKGSSPFATGAALVEVGKPAPDFELSTLDGQTVRLSDFRGKAVALNFWATWCDPCKIETPWLVDLQKEYGPQGLQVVGVAMDDAGKDAIQGFVHEMGINYVILQGKNAVGDEYEAQGYPTTVYIDRSGKVVNRVVGLVSRSEIDDNIKQALASGGSRAAAMGAAAPAQGK